MARKSLPENQATLELLPRTTQDFLGFFEPLIRQMEAGLAMRAAWAS
jgi:hypothetical protein